ncbi:Zn-dependent hydrolase [Virgibacillus sp. C22-A2]|uniref:Zn-dependent hydrolase n=1 Tax=Virgibacillus tibetensis TaxID=3042313 RepID=A0ABU6KDX2_9BACI|nr:Zn-dependent hydrolase [Virgibacillus sp. C22-A2]
MEKSSIHVNFERLKQTLDKSSQIGKIPDDGLRRLALSNDDKQMREVFVRWLELGGLDIRIDDIGNMYGRRSGLTDLPPVLIGSHLDTQPNGGRFDGILGVLTALEVLRTLNDNDIKTMRPIEIVNFTNEEGARFEPPLLGSGGIAEVFDRNFIYSRMDRNGNTFKEELEKIGFKGDSENRIKDIHSFLELHIEQGPVLENEQISIGAVEGIKGMSWFELRVIGEGGHAGPTPMAMRRDALMVAAKLILHIEEKGELSGPETSVTIGRMSVKPDVVNCIPEEVLFSLDIRHIDDNVRERLIDELKKELKEIAQGHKVQLEFNKLWEVKTSTFHPEIVNLICNGSKKLGYSVKRMFSGAGHDAKYINRIAPTSMIFLPSVGGKSHVEAELTLDSDIEKGANILLHSVLELSNYKESLS